VILGLSQTVPAVMSDAGKVVVNKSEISSIKTELNLCENIKAPVEAGQKLGTLKIICNDNVLSEVPIVAKCSVERKSTGDIFWQLISKAFMR